MLEKTYNELLTTNAEMKIKIMELQERVVSLRGSSAKKADECTCGAIKG